ncbi:hypothetical protein [Parafrankia soli]|uniref:hypothetical protein n=1 Tax=Parafrankia soli TaxID=2599596 RepID=UPI0012FF77BD|nr:hypothetical protein [Parafrankia soli]
MTPKSSGIRIVSFGYLHGRPPGVDIIVDLREFRDPTPPNTSATSPPTTGKSRTSS